MTPDSTAKHVIPQDSSAPQYDSVVTTQSVVAGFSEGLYPAALSKHRSGDWTGAEQNYRNILAVEPNHAGANHFLGMLHFQRGQIKEALPFLKKAIQIKPNEAVYRNNYGVVLKELRRLEEAESAFQKAASLAPTYADARSNLGLVCLLKNDLKRAEYELESALTLEPNHLDAQKHLGELRFQQGEQFASQENFDEAADRFHQAATLQGGQELWHWKSLGFCPSVFQDEESIEQYWNRLDEGLDAVLNQNVSMDWRSLPTDGFYPSFNLAHINKPCRNIREKFCKIFEKAFPFSLPTTKRLERNNGRWRLGFHTLHGHEGGFIRGTAGLINALDKKRFDVFVFASNAGIKRCQEKIQYDGVTFVPLGGSFEEVVKRVRETECHLIYYRKAGSDPWSYFFPFARCAPLQVTSYGTHGTSGIGGIDYFLSSTYVEPENGQDYYTEKLFLLNSMPTYQERLKALKTPVSRFDFNIPSHGAVYFCPHRTAKYHPSFDQILKTIAQRDPQGHFVLLTGRDKRGHRLLHERLRRNLGEAIYKRIIFLPAVPFEKYCCLLSLATVMLDSPVYAGGLTSFDAFSYNVPEVTLSGPLHVQNFATGIYRRMGLEHLPCSSVDTYIDLAVRLGTEPQFRDSVSREIEARRDKIFASSEIVEEHTRFFESVCGECFL